jgi:hypothetical protein
MQTPKIAVINQSSFVADAGGRQLTAALQTQVTRDFAPIWGESAMLYYVAKGQHPLPGSWWLVLLDDADQAGALGYHDITAQDLPLGKVFCKTTIQDGGQYTVTASHELVEMLGDPHINLAAVASLADGTTMVFAYETADAVEADKLGYMIGTVLVSDFVTPAWFDPAALKGTRFDFGGHVTAPLQLLPGGYIGVLSTADNWSQLTADAAPHHAATARYAGNRWHRRLASRTSRTRSTAHAEAMAAA